MFSSHHWCKNNHKYIFKLRKRLWQDWNDLRVLLITIFESILLLSCTLCYQKIATKPQAKCIAHPPAAGTLRGKIAYNVPSGSGHRGHCPCNDFNLLLTLGNLYSSKLFTKCKLKRKFIRYGRFQLKHYVYTYTAKPNTSLFSLYC